MSSSISKKLSMCVLWSLRLIHFIYLFSLGKGAPTFYKWKSITYILFWPECFNTAFTDLAVTASILYSCVFLAFIFSMKDNGATLSDVCLWIFFHTFERWTITFFYCLNLALVKSIMPLSFPTSSTWQAKI